MKEISELKLENRRLKRGSGRTNSGMKSIAGLEELILQVNKNGIIEYANTAFANSVHLKKNDITGKHYAELYDFDFGRGLFKTLISQDEEQGNAAIERSYYDKELNKTKFIEISVYSQDKTMQIKIKDLDDRLADRLK